MNLLFSVILGGETLNHDNVHRFSKSVVIYLNVALKIKTGELGISLDL